MSDLNDIHAATGNLHQLLAVIYETVTDLDFVRQDGSRNTVADRLAALSILARDEAERIDAAVEAAITGRKPDLKLAA